MNSELKTCALSNVLFRGYAHRRLSGLCDSLVRRWEGGEFYSSTLRLIFRHYHGVEVGAYSYGSCFVPGTFDRGTRVGRYVSIGPGVRVFLRNHPYDRLSMHPFFYNSKLRWLAEDNVSFGSLEIGHDSWIGACTIFTPGCSKVGIGAIVGAGSVVTKDVPDFAIAAGNPARVLRLRFPESTCSAILASRWWEASIEEVARSMDWMTRPLADDPYAHPLLLKANAKVALP